MPVLAVYLVPAPDHPLYQLGSAFLGYDAYRGTLSAPLLAEQFGSATLAAWIGQARIFGFHSTIGDALAFAEADVPEVLARLEWISGRIAPFALTAGSFHTYERYPNTLALDYRAAGPQLAQLHYQVVTAVNVLYQHSPFFDARRAQLSQDDQYYLTRYGVPHYRLLDRFVLHFSLATRLPDRATWQRVHDTLRAQRALFTTDDTRSLWIDQLHLLEQRADGYFQISHSFALRGGSA